MRYRADVGEAYEFTAPPEAAGSRLDVFLAEKLRNSSRAFIKRLIDDQLIEVAPGRAKPAYRLKGGEKIAVFLPEPVEMSAAPEDIPLAVIHEDEHLIVIDKPAGMVVHPSPGHESGTLVNALLHHCADLSGIGGVLRPGIVHRLDRNTSGCLVAAKTDAAHQELSAQFAARTVQKTYLAITRGVPEPADGLIQGKIGRHPKHRQLQAMVSAGGRESLTHYSVREDFGEAALVECRPHTGRTHQIRVHLKHLGTPIIGDADYGRRREKAELASLIGRQALHAWKLAFTHPQTGERLESEAPLPADMEAALAQLRGGGERRRG